MSAQVYLNGNSYLHPIQYIKQSNISSFMLLKTTNCGLMVLVAICLTTATCFKFASPQNSKTLITHENFITDSSDEDENKQKGSQIDTDFEALLKQASELAYVFHGDNYYKNIELIRDKVNAQYEGDWLITILRPTSQTPVKPGQSFAIASNSVDGEWWIYWKGANHYQPEYAYYLSKIQPSDSNSTQNSSQVACYTQSNNSYSYSYVFRNIVSALESQTISISEEAEQLAHFLNVYDETVNPTVIMSKNLPFMGCQWGVKEGMYDSRSVVNSYVIAVMPRVDDKK